MQDFTPIRFDFSSISVKCPSSKSVPLQEGHIVQNKQGRGQKRDDLPLYPMICFPPAFPSTHPPLPLVAVLLTTVTTALIMPLWSPRVAGTCHPLPRGAWVITSIHPSSRSLAHRGDNHTTSSNICSSGEKSEGPKPVTPCLPVSDLISDPTHGSIGLNCLLLETEK